MRAWAGRRADPTVVLTDALLPVSTACLSPIV
jgi:hypothetical protein